MKKLVLPLVALLLGTGCMYRVTPIVNTTDISQVDWSKASSMKHGQSCLNLLFSAIPIGGTMSLVNAVEDAQVTKVHAVANRYKSYYFFTQACIEVWGE